jgi:hypothetical protein
LVIGISPLQIDRGPPFAAGAWIGRNGATVKYSMRPDAFAKDRTIAHIAIAEGRFLR